MLADVRRVASFSAGISHYLRADLSDEALAARLRNALATREERLLAMFAAGVFARPASPYLALLRHAGVEQGDIATLVGDEGPEGALLRLRDAGFHLTAEELKGRAPIVRGSLTLDVRAEDFDNPFGPGGLSSISGGTSGTPLRLGLSITDLEEDIAYVRPWLAGAGLLGSPLVLWRGVPPSRSGLRNAFRSLRSGLVLHSWWSPTPVGFLESPRDRLALSVARGVARAHGARIPAPRHAPLSDPSAVLDTLAGLASAGRRPVLDATAGAAARLCGLAAARGVSLHGVTIRTGGEPLTDAKAAVMRATGAVPACHYQASELGRIGVACSDAASSDTVATDDVHIASGRVLVIERPIEGEPPRLLLTCLSPTSQLLLLNADIGDTAVLVRRSCGCPLGALGLDLHAHTIRSVAKITSGGVSILHAELLELVEQTLPARFGGSPSDYQLVETEERGVPRVEVYVSPRVGPVAERDVVDTVLAAVAEGPTWRAMVAGWWQDGETVRVVRRDPILTQAGKLHAFRRLSA
jgi:hypothetical protein